MDWTANVAVHESASPAFLRQRILAALRQGQMHPSLLYAGVRQASLWSALHRAFSPAQRDADCIALYEHAFARGIERTRGNVLHVVSLASGDGSKDVRCLQQIRSAKKTVLYTPADISLDLALTAAQGARSALPGLQTTPLLCDLPYCSVLPAILKGFDPSGAERLLLFLGTIHNYWPPEILRAVLYPLRSQDQLLLGANLVPAENYDAELSGILAQYDNLPTRQWLLGALSELGLGSGDGELSVAIAPTPDPTLKRIEAVFTMSSAKRLSVLGEAVPLETGQKLSVFFSHRFTAQHVHGFLERAGLTVLQTWIGAGGYEGLFLCGRTPGVEALSPSP